MQTGLKIILIGLISMMGFSGYAQIKFKLELLPDEKTYQVSLVSDVSWTNPPFNFTASAQITIRAPHGKPPNNFRLENLTPLQPNTDWNDNVYCPAPPEAPAWDYVSIALISPGNGIPYIEGEEIPLFTFENGAVSCTDSIELIDNFTDPFLAPNSKGANIAHSIVTVGGGLGGSYSGNIGTGKAPCVPVLNCPEILTEFEEEICFGSSFRGMFFEHDTLLIDHYISCEGCDSLVQTYIKVFSDYDLLSNETICSGENFNGVTYYADATIFENLVSTAGCDSLRTTYLTVLPHAASTVDTLLCSGEMYDGLAYFENTIVTKIMVATNGCDSVITSFIEVTPLEFDTTEITVCEGTEMGGQVFYSDGNYQETFAGIDGCDTFSLLTNVKVNFNSENMVNELLIAGDFWNGVPYFNDTTTIHVLENEVGCDSVLTGNLRVFPPNSTILDTLICEGELLYGKAFFNDTLLIDTISDSNFLVTVVDVQPTTIIQHEMTICEGETVNGMAYFQDTILREVYSGTDVCDSVVMTNIYVIAPIESSQNISLCKGDNFNGISYDSNTVLVDTFISELTGCDSILYTNLNIIFPKETFLEASICEGEVYEGVIYHNDELITKKLISEVDGCDSIVQINLEVFSNPTPTILGENVFCKGETVELSTQNYKTYQWNNGSFEQTINISQSGTYELTITNTNDCAGSTTFEATALEVETSPFAFAPNCKTPKGKILFENTNGGMPPYIFSIDGGQFFEVDSLFENLVPNQYELLVEDINGCRWESPISVPEEVELSVHLPNDLRMDLGDSIRLPLQINFPQYDTIIWSPPHGLSCTDCPNPFAKPLESTHYQAMVFDEFGCQTKADIIIYVSQKSKVYIPNIFSPNGDGNNDKFFPYGGADVRKIKKFRVFDRYGALVFEQTNFSPNDSNYGWDGGKYSSGTYVYMLEIEFINNQIELFKGDVILMR